MCIPLYAHQSNLDQQGIPLFLLIYTLKVIFLTFYSYFEIKYLFDLKTHSSNELFNLAIEDLIGDNIVIVEWPDLLKKIIHHDYINISFELNNKNERHIVVTTTNPCNLNLLKQIYLDS